MASKSKEHVSTDKCAKAGGKIASCFSTSGSRRSSAAGLSSGGESSRSSSDEDPDEFVKDVIPSEMDSMEFSPALGRPDRVTTIRQIPGTSLKDFVVRASETSNHVLVMGSPSMLFHPLSCPFKEGRCASFRAYCSQDLKEHLEATHKLDNVQVNLACPCPAVCNVINGQPQKCRAIEYDPMDGLLEGHISKQHPTYFNTMGYYLCSRNAPEEQLLRVPEEVRNYGQYLKTSKKLPAWTREDPLHSQLFPSQIFPEKVILQAVIEDKTIMYTCNIPPCRGKQAMGRNAMSGHLLHEPGHRERIGHGARIVERCPVAKCDVCVQWYGQKMTMLHVRAMHPEALGGPSSNPTEAAKTELAKLLGQIKGTVIGRAVSESDQPGDESDGTKAHYLYSFSCHLQNCQEYFDERDHLEWHIMADHQRDWNPSGASD